MTETLTRPIAGTPLGPDSSTTELLSGIAACDETAWAELVRRHTPMLTGVVRRCGLGGESAADVVQTVWLRLVEHHHQLRDPECLVGWLVRVARREAWRIAARQHREVGAGEFFDDLPDHAGAEVDSRMLVAEERAELRQAIETLPPRQRELLVLLAADCSMSYQDVSAATGMPVGSIGPTRARALLRLRPLLASHPVAVGERMAS